MLYRTQKRVGHGRERREKGNKKRRSGKSINLLVRLVTELLTKYCMVAYECNILYDNVHMYIILIINYPLSRSEQTSSCRKRGQTSERTLLCNFITEIITH